MTMQTEESEMEEEKGFRFKNENLTSRCKDVFGCLDALEQKHQAFEDQRKEEDAEIDRGLISQGPSSHEMDTVDTEFKKPATFSGRDYHHVKKGGYHGHHSRDRSDQHVEQFKKPQHRPGRGRFWRGRASPDYQRHPENWTRYSLEDVDVSDTANKQAAFSFLEERRQAREGSSKEEAVDLENSACSRGFIAFNRKSKSKSDVGDRNTSSSKGGASSSILSVSDTLQQADVEMAEETEENECNCDINEASSTEDMNDLQTMKRKLDEFEEKDSSEQKTMEKNVGFKSRKMAKRNIRARRDREEEVDDSS